MRVWLLLSTALLVCAEPTPAQPPFEIRGVVVDKATSQPIAGVRITLLKPGENVNPPWATSDDLGAFRFPLAATGSYTLSTEAKDYPEGYVRTDVSSKDPVTTVRIVLDPGLSIRGRLIDDDSREPIAHLKALIVTANYHDGTYLALPRAGDETDEEGRFRATGVGADDPTDPRVLVAVLPSLWWSEEPHLTRFSPADVEATDEDYVMSYWPGGGDLTSALPIDLRTASEVDVGTLQLKKIRYRRALLHLAECIPGQSYEVWLQHAHDIDLTYRASVEITCGQDLVLRGLAPNQPHRIDVRPVGDTPSAKWRGAQLEFTPRDKNLQLQVVLRPGTDLTGVVRLPKDSAPRPSSLRIRLAGSATAPSPDGTFVIPNVLSGDRELRVMDLGGTHVIREIKYGGQPILAVERQTLHWSGIGSLEITLDDKPSTIAGSVTNRAGDPVAKAAIVAVRWPVPTTPGGIFEARIEAATDTNGHYSFPRVPAGEYRALAIPGSLKYKLEEPGVLDRLLLNTARVTVARGASATLDLTITDPTR